MGIFGTNPITNASRNWPVFDIPEGIKLFVHIPTAMAQVECRVGKKKLLSRTPDISFRYMPPVSYSQIGLETGMYGGWIQARYQAMDSGYQNTYPSMFPCSGFHLGYSYLRSQCTTRKCAINRRNPQNHWDDQENPRLKCNPEPTSTCWSVKSIPLVSAYVGVRLRDLQHNPESRGNYPR